MIVTLNPIERRVDYVVNDESSSFYFDDLDEWKQDGKYFFHFDYEKRDDFNSQREWLIHILSAYDNIGGDQDEQLIQKTFLEL